MTNIEKLIANTKINHGGVEATETKLEAMARVIEQLVEGLQEIIEREEYIPSKNYSNNEILIAVNTLEEAEEIAGAVC
jgi:protein-arginine kinase activator protein McsA